MEAADDGKHGRDGSGSVSAQVARFYDDHGWVDQGDGASGEDTLFRRFPAGHSAYAAGVIQRTHALSSGRGGSLLVVGCGDMPQYHVDMTGAFANVTCMDISSTALTIAQRRVGAAAAYRCESIVHSTLASGQFDYAVCAHVIYHIGQDEQEQAVRQLIRLAKPGGRIVIIYANPRSIFTVPGEMMRWIKRGLRLQSAISPALYYHAHPLGWWRRFSPDAVISLVPWEVIGSRPARALLRGEAWPVLFYRAAARLEARVPALAARLWQYPIVILDKPAENAA